MQAGVGLAGTTVWGVGEIESSSVSVGAARVAVGVMISGLGVEKEMLTAGLGEVFGLEGGMNKVGVAVVAQAARRK